MTTFEQTAEVIYRTKERLGILSAGKPPEPWMYELAQREAEQWLAEQRPYRSQTQQARLPFKD